MNRVGSSFGEDLAVACLLQWTNTVRLNRVGHFCVISYRLRIERRENKNQKLNSTHIFETTRSRQQARPFAEAWLPIASHLMLPSHPPPPNHHPS